MIQKTDLFVNDFCCQKTTHHPVNAILLKAIKAHGELGHKESVSKSEAMRRGKFNFFLLTNSFIDT